MLAIKLQRIGKKHQPSYRVVVAEKRSKLGGPPVEDLGAYSLATKQLTVDKARAEHWMQLGAQATTTVWNLFVKNGVVSGKAVAVKMKKAKPAEVEAKPAEKAAVATAAPAA